MSEPSNEESSLEISNFYTSQESNQQESPDIFNDIALNQRAPLPLHQTTLSSPPYALPSTDLPDLRSEK